MTPKQDLHKLIHALTASEKRHFKLYSKIMGGKTNQKYLLLFNAIDKMAVYDEQKLKAKFKKEPFINQLSVVKNYLYQSILKSIIACNMEKTNNSKWYFILQSIELLFEKGLLDNCLKEISKNKIECLKEQHLSFYNILCDWEMRILMRLNKRKETVLITKTQLDYLQLLEKNIQYKHEAALVFYYIDNTENIYGNDKKIATGSIEKIIKKPLEDNATDFAKYYYYTTRNLYYGAIKNNKERLSFSMKALALFHGNQEFLTAYTYLYLISANNVCNALLAINDKKALLKMIKKIDETINILPSSKSYSIVLMMKEMLLRTRLFFYLNNNDIKAALKLQPDIDMLLKNKKMQSLSYMEMNYYLALTYFLSEKYTKALDYLKPILEVKRQYLLSDIVIAARIFQLIIHKELQNDVLLHNLIKSTQSFLKKHDILSPFDEMLLKYLCLQADNAEKVAMKNTLIKLSTRKNTHSLLDNFFDIMQWLKAN